jgi:hypothetical protein
VVVELVHVVCRECMAGHALTCGMDGTRSGGGVPSFSRGQLP